MSWRSNASVAASRFRVPVSLRLVGSALSALKKLRRGKSIGGEAAD
jgi:hypothetical protein